MEMKDQTVPRGYGKRRWGWRTSRNEQGDLPDAHQTKKEREARDSSPGPPKETSGVGSSYAHSAHYRSSGQCSSPNTALSSSPSILDLCKASPQTILNKHAQIKNATYVPPSFYPARHLARRYGGELGDRGDGRYRRRWVLGEAIHQFLPRRIPGVIEMTRWVCDLNIFRLFAP
jgi:hypothetical protein